MDKGDNIFPGVDMGRLPHHVAIIMDGNGRWARLRGLPRSQGHASGVTSVNRVTRLASDMGIKFLTLYAFSTENWNRPQEEVDALMHLIAWTILKEAPELASNNVRVRIIGDFDRLPEEARTNLQRGLDMTAHCTGLTLVLSLSYSSRWELTHAAKCMASDALKGLLDPAAINENTIDSYLSTSGIPDPDLLIRTGGEQRISNFLLWQIAYSELYFTDTLWPDFGRDDFLDAIIDFQNRERRFGKTGDQVKNNN